MQRAWQAVLLATAASVLAACQSGPAHAGTSFDPVELQKNFGRAKNLELITRAADIPADGQRMLAVLAGNGVLSPESAKPLAEMGMDWSSGDAKIGDLPWGQHQFSAVSDHLVAILFVTGGWEVHYNLLLAPRDSSEFCWFSVPSLHPSNLRLSVLQDLVRPDRDQTISKTPECRLMRSREAGRQSN